jgi:hypothetical protein
MEEAQAVAAEARSKVSALDAGRVRNAAAIKVAMLDNDQAALKDI